MPLRMRVFGRASQRASRHDHWTPLLAGCRRCFLGAHPDPSDAAAAWVAHGGDRGWNPEAVDQALEIVRHNRVAVGAVLLASRPDGDGNQAQYARRFVV